MVEKLTSNACSKNVSYLYVLHLETLPDPVDPFDLGPVVVALRTGPSTVGCILLRDGGPRQRTNTFT